jgi:two-component system, LytTR family, sensor kinase
MTPTRLRRGPFPLDVVLGLLLGIALTAAALAAARLVTAPRRVLAPGDEGMRAALHAATAPLPHLRQGLSAESAARSVGHLRRLTQASALAVADRDRILAIDGADDGVPRAGDALEEFVTAGRDDRLHVEPQAAAVVAPLTVQGERVGSLVAYFRDPGRVRPEDTRVMREAAALVAAQVELSWVAEQEERLARAELRALRAQISPHFIYNALAAVARYIHTRPEEARELLTEFAEFTRYAFRRERPYVTLADELQYVEKYLRLEQARFGDRLTVRVEVAPEVLGAVVPALSLQPLVENAVRHGVEARTGVGTVEIVGRDLGPDVELRVVDDGAGMDGESARRLLDGGSIDGFATSGIGLKNVHGRLQATFGAEYGLRLRSGPGEGTAVTMTVPKFRAGVRAA